MKASTLIRLASRGLSTLIWQRNRPMVGSLIVTDRCNLNCRHCAVSNLVAKDYSFQQIKSDLETLFDSGCRIVFLYGGEPLLWTDGDHTLADIVQQARETGFWLVNIVTNGTRSLNVPDVDLFLVSLDGNRGHHNTIRGETYDQVLTNIQTTTAPVVLYMAINAINLADIEEEAALARKLTTVQAVSYNFHTPYPGTEGLSLSREEKLDCARRIASLIDQNYPILNLRSVLPRIARNNASVPSRHCLVMENGQVWVCGRCREIPGLCQQCGFFFAAEYSLVFSGNPPVLFDLFRTYRRLWQRS